MKLNHSIIKIDQLVPAWINILGIFINGMRPRDMLYIGTKDGKKSKVEWTFTPKPSLLLSIEIYHTSLPNTQ